MEKQTEAGLWVVWGGGHYLTEDAMSLAGRVDDVPLRTLRSALGAFLPNESAHRERHKIHDREVVDLLLRCKRDGMDVVGPRS